MLLVDRLICKWAALAWLVFSLPGWCVAQYAKTQQPYLLVLSMDGFRWDYTQLAETPNFDRLAAMGVRAESLIPSFPSKTFPNHYTMVTGLYPGNHGLVNNMFYDSKLGISYTVKNRQAVQNAVFYGGEPIWNTAKKQGVESGIFYWIGSEAPIQGMRPRYWKKYDGSVPFRARIDTLMQWLKKPAASRPHLVMGYVHEPDFCGHHHAIHSLEMRVELQRLDSLLGYLLAEIEKLPIAQQINLIVTTDHGMCQVSPDRTIVLSEFLDENHFEQIIPNSPIVFLYPKAEYATAVTKQLSQIKHIRTYDSSNRPAHWHYPANARIPALVLVADSAYQLVWEVGKRGYLMGTHGYDPANKDMHGIFYAKGPCFKQGYVQPSFKNIDLYAIMAQVLGIKPAKTDGSLAAVQGMFVRQQK